MDYTATTMDLPPKIDSYIKESIDHILGLPVSVQTLRAKLQASEESQRQLCQQRLYLLAKLKEKDDLIKLARNEAYRKRLERGDYADHDTTREKQGSAMRERDEYSDCGCFWCSEKEKKVTTLSNFCLWSDIDS